MSYLNANIPPIYCNIRREYLYDLKQNYGETQNCVVFGVASIPGRAVLFHCLLESGAIYYRLPISAFIQKGFDRRNVPDQDLKDLELWNSFSYFPNIICFDFLKGQSCKYINKGKTYNAEYLFTIDWAHPDANILDTEHSEIPHEHKCGHVLALCNGNYAIQPNNRILWNVPSFTTSSHKPDYKVQTTYWNVENKNWVTEDSDNMFYQVNEIEKD
jgi:hypothetical protein